LLIWALHRQAEPDSSKQANNYASVVGHVYCTLNASGAVVRYGMIGSAVNLASIAIERYIMVVHPIWHKNHFRSSFNYAAVVIAWANGILAVQPATSMIFNYEDGKCRAKDFGRPGSLVYYVWLFLSYFCIIFVVIVVCYARIAVAIRRRIGVFAARQATSSQAAVRVVRNHTNYVKTTIFISMIFLACWLPCHVYVLSMHVLDPGAESDVSEIIERVVCFLAFLNYSLNPFVYAARFNPVKIHLARLVDRVRGIPLTTLRDNNLPEVLE